VDAGGRSKGTEREVVAQLVALRNIKAGEEATISYIDQCVLALSRPSLLLRPLLRCVALQCKACSTLTDAD
jgi:hypothetical protein